jgi:hypothetical protein
MIQTRAVQSQAEAHRKDLAASAVSRRSHHAVDRAAAAGPAATQRSAAGLPVTGGRAMRRAVVPRIGSWLIGLGTRMGGASIRTS